VSIKFHENYKNGGIHTQAQAFENGTFTCLGMSMLVVQCKNFGFAKINL
jgi:hypothetical protein